MSFIRMLSLRILLLVFIYQLTRLIFFLFNLRYFESVHWPDWGSIIVGSLRFDLSAIMYSNVLYIALYLFPFVHRRHAWVHRLALWLFVGVNGIMLSANILDSAYFPFTLRRTNASLFREFQHDTHLFASAGDFITTHGLLLALIPLVFYLLWKTYPLITIPIHRSDISSRVLFFPAGLVWLGLARGSFIPSDRPINISLAGDYAPNPAAMSLVLNTPISIMTTWGNIKVPEVMYYPSLAEAEKVYSPIQCYPSDSLCRKNVVVIIVESMSKEFVGALNPGKVSYTPFLDELIAESLVFPDAFANGRRSIEALPSVMASIPSLSEAYVLTPYVTNRIQSLASVLRKNGWHTTFFHGGHDKSMGFSAFMHLAGVEGTYSKSDYGKESDYDGTWGIYDEPFMQYWAEALAKEKTPFFSTLFTVTSHHPFRIPESLEDSILPGNIPIHRSIRYTDRALRRFFETAAKMTWYKNTVFVITADHTSAYSDCSDYQNNRGFFSVPLLFFTPDSSLKGVSDRVAQQADIYPTLCDYLGVNDTLLCWGASLLDKRESVVVNYYSGMYQVFTRDWMLQMQNDQVVGLYAYRSDVQLQQEVKNKYPEVVNDLRQKLKAYIQSYNSRVRTNAMTVDK